MNSGIYCLTNNLNGKKYIGQSKNIEERLRIHSYAWKCKNREGYNCPLYKDIRKYGYENFSSEILENVEPSKLLLDEKEVFWIKKIGTLIPNGYNVTKGGKNNVSRKVSQEKLLEIVNMLKEGKSSKEIKRKFKISIQFITDINVGRSRKIDGVEYPIRERKHKKITRCSICGKPLSNGSRTATGLCSDCLRKKSKTKDCLFVKNIIEEYKERKNYTYICNKYKTSRKTIKKILKQYMLH